MNSPGSRRLLTFRLDQEQRQRLRARLAREGRTMSEVVTHGLRQYVQAVLARGDDPPEPPAVPPGGTHPPGPPLGRGSPPPRTPPTGAARADRGPPARAPPLRAQRAAIRDAGRAERSRLAAAPARRSARHQPAGGAGTRPPPGSGPAPGSGAPRAHSDL